MTTHDIELPDATTLLLNSVTSDNHDTWNVVMPGLNVVVVKGIDVTINPTMTGTDTSANSIGAFDGADVIIGTAQGVCAHKQMTYKIEGESSLTYRSQGLDAKQLDHTDFEFTGDAGGTLKLLLPSDPKIDIPTISISGLRPGDNMLVEMNNPYGGANILPKTLYYDRGEGLLSLSFNVNGANYEFNGAPIKWVRFQLDEDMPAGYSFKPNGDGSLSYACYLRGTHIATPDGETKVEALQAGDKVLTAGGQVATVKWLGYRKLTASRIPAQDALKAFPITFQKDAIADNVPHRDLTISPYHHLYFDGKLIPAMALVNGLTITQDFSRQSFEYFHVELDHFDILLAEGVAAESYVDTGNRSMFQNVNPTSMLADFGPAPGRQSIAGMKIVRKGPVVEALRERLRQRAEAIAPVVQPVVQRCAA
ncbi:Hint domain-containing protein [Bordetella tumulicola]|uniref:Hint domain-containing protein n=1 Tax=Bordetella tumulicola TaxID=1649133 RepID=UPI0039EF092C